MAFTVVLSPKSLAAAKMTATLRPVNVRKHIPPEDPDADLYGAMAEHAFAQHMGIPQSAINRQSLPTGGDGGIDFTVDGKTVDIKSSARHPNSWLVPAGNLRAEWYIFATVTMPNMVTFKGKATREQLERIAPITVGKEGSQKKKRLVYLSEVDDIGPQDFKRQPRRKRVRE
jgi:hypothetical protein